MQIMPYWLLGAQRYVKILHDLLKIFSSTTFTWSTLLPIFFYTNNIVCLTIFFFVSPALRFNFPARYHVENCTIIRSLRNSAYQKGYESFIVAGVLVDHSLFKPRRRIAPVPAKWKGFVLSSSVSTRDPALAPTEIQRKKGIKVGRKGYVRCVYCNTEIFAPNSKRHAAVCSYFRRVWYSHLTFVHFTALDVRIKVL